MNKAKSSVNKKPEKKPDLVDDILNGTSSAKEQSVNESHPLAKERKPPEVEKPKTEKVEKKAFEKSVEEKIEPGKIVADIRPSKGGIKKGQRVVNEDLAGQVVKGSVGHDLLIKVQLDENGVSEPISDQRIVDKLLSCGFKLVE